MHILLFLLFFVLFASKTLNFDLSLAPGLSVKNAFLYLIFAVLALDAALTRRYKLEIMPVLTPFALYVYYAVFTWVVLLLLVDYQGYSARASLISLKADAVDHLLVLLIFFYGTRAASQGIRVIRSMVWLIMLGNLVTVVDALDIPDLGLIEQRTDGRVGGPMGSSNEYALFLTAFLPAMLALAWSETGIKRAVAGAGAIISFLAFLMAVSRGAMVGLVAGSLVGAFYMREFIPARVMMRAGITAVFCVVVAVVAMFTAGEYGQLLTERFAQFDAGTMNTVSSGRTMIWLTALESMAENPVTFITGYGWEAYNSFYFRYGTHNTYLGVLFDLGLIGLGLLLLTYLNVLRTACSALRHATPDNRRMLMAFLFGFLSLLAGLFFNSLHTSWLYVWAFAGISLRLAVAEQETSTATAEEGPVSGVIEPRQTAGTGGAHP